MDRRLTTILAADVAGFSRMMEANEPATFAALQAHLAEFIKPEIAEHGGRIIKTMGDGLLAEFPSVVDGVRCAVRLQEGMTARNEHHDHPMTLRIGVHLGDVIVEGDDLLGDGVNIAARLESMAEPGGICVSKQVMDQIAPHTDQSWTDLGPCKLKNIVRPVHVFSSLAPPAASPRRFLKLGGAVLVAAGVFFAAVQFDVPRHLSSSGTAPVTRDAALLPSLAVLPFESPPDAEDQDYLADGITDDLITDLAKVSGLVVIARSSSFAYRDQVDPVAIAKALNVQYIVQGSLRRAGDRIRINARLVDGDSGANLWADRYDREMSDIFDLQDDVRERIVSALKVKLTPEEVRQLSQSLTDNTDAYDAYLRARQQESFFAKESTLEAIGLYHKALELDPDFVTAKARLATAYTIAAESNWVEDPVSALSLARSLAKEAIAKDDTLPLAYWALARVYTRKEFFDGDAAIDALEQAIAIDPNYADGHAMLANALHLVGRAEDGLAHIETAMRLNPRFPFWYYYALGANQFHLTRFEAAEESFLKSIDRNPRWRPHHVFLVSTYGHLGQPDDAEWEMDELRALGFEPTLQSFRDFDKIQDDSYRTRFFEGLKKAGVSED